jgi:glycosyltransferase involved in cell wall biosynthesis
MTADYSLSLVVPMFNEAGVIPELFRRVLPILEGLTSRYEIICVDDGSVDETASLLIAHRQNNPKIKILRLSRNFGKEAALTAGLDLASGDGVIPIDADLQDPPELIPQLVEKWREGYDCVLAIRKDRSSDTFIKRITARFFYRIANRITESPIPTNAGDFRLMDRRVAAALRRLPERTRFMKGIFGWLGFKQAMVPYVREGRAAGTSKWRYWGLWNFALNGIFSFSTLPLRIWTYLGLSVALLAVVYMAFIIVRTLTLGVEVPGYSSLLVAILFFSGLNMVGLGILGEYLGRVFIEVKQRPLYLVAESIGFDQTDPQASTSATENDLPN